VKIRAFVLADNVAPGAGGKTYLHGGGISLINAPRFPWQQPSLAVWIALEREDESHGQDYLLTVEFLDPTGEPLGAGVNGNFRLSPAEVEGVPERVNVAASFDGVVFPEPGAYAIRASVDGDELDRLPFVVIPEQSEAQDQTEAGRPVT
jgi:hypothetical protein